jgi:hypothetical protein
MLDGDIGIVGYACVNIIGTNRSRGHFVSLQSFLKFQAHESITRTRFVKEMKMKVEWSDIQSDWKNDETQSSSSKMSTKCLLILVDEIQLKDHV